MVRRAEALIRPYIRETALERAYDLEAGEGTVWLKLENQQITGSFKARGSLHKMLTIPDDIRAAGIVTASAGNHALGVAHAAALLNVNSTIFLPENVDQSRRETLGRYPLELRLFGNDCGQTEAYARDVATKTGRTYISPYDDPDVIAGQGTVAMEILRQLPEVDVLFIAVGGGGLLSGMAAYAKAIKPSITIVATSPCNSPAMFDLLAATPREFCAVNDTLADSVGGTIDERSMTIDLCRALIDQWILVEEEEIHAAMKFLFFEHRQVVEGSGALAVAAYLKERSRYLDKNVALLVCGGNIEMKRYCSTVFTKGG